jgi:hypothetical protein
VTPPHGFTDPIPVRFHSGTQPRLHRLNVALPKRCSQLGCNRCGLGATVM